MDLITSPTVENFQSENIPSTDPTTNPSPEKHFVEADPNENSSANSSLTKMESLLVHEEENDEDDHGLGTESLRLSGSDDDDDDDMPTVRRKKGPTQRIVESDDDDDGNKGVEREQNPSESTEIANKPNKFSALIDSESEPELTEEALMAPKKSVNDMKKKKKNSEKTKKNKPPPSVDSSSESEEEPTKQKSKISDLVDSDSETSNAGSANEDEDQNEQSKKQPSQRPKKPQRASAKKAIDEMQAIQSETQRLYRETQVNIPYHKPKRHTLKEFLTRRTIAKPNLSQNGPGKSLKMTPEELEEYAKHLEERAKEATEFFKSESEDELKDVQDDESTTEKQQEQPEEPMETSTSETKQSEEQSEATRPLTTQEIDQILEDHEFISQPSTQDILGDIQTESESPSTSLAPSVEPSNAAKPSALSEQSTPTTSSAASVVQNKPSALAELKRRLIAEKNIPLVPKLKGDSNMMIDFETGDMFARKPTGVENLFERFMKSNKNKKKPEDPTPSQELQTTLKVAVIQESNKEKEPKPGAAYVKLKENLRALISRKRKEEFRKKVEESKEEEEEYNKCCGLDENDEDEEEEKEPRSKPTNREKDIIIDDEENEIELEDYEIDEEDEETEPTEDQTNEEPNERGAAAEENMEQDQGEDENEENESDSSSSSSSDEDETNTEDPSTRKHRVIKAFQDSDDETGPGLNETSTSVLYAEEEKKNPEDVETELLGLCSGQFAETQARPVIISQIPITQTPGNVTETELEDLCSGVFNEANTQVQEVENTQVEKPHKTAMRIVSSDEEKEPDEEPDVKKVKKLKKKKKKHVKLGFSDDEEDDDDEDEQNSVDENDQEEDEEEIPQTFIDYDSEENEIEVQMSKKDCVKKANAFLENEAELSESEWGSADEDERNLDKYDMELGDEDEFDQQKLQSELEQIHMRKVLDDDIREVKKIQEMLFEDEEADGVGRQRKFRWKNAESGFSLDDPAGGAGADNDEQVDSADDEEERKWRTMRFEREQFLLKKSKEEIIADVSTTEIGKRLLRTIETDNNFVVEKEEIKIKEYKAPSFLIQERDHSILRNSLLKYDQEVLAKMAESITKSGDYDRDENEEGFHKKASKTGNFVFVPLSKEQVEMRKRRAEELKEGNAPKKTKVCTKQLFLDGLLE